MKRVLLTGILLVGAAALSLEERWCFEAGATAYSAPIAEDFNGDGKREVAVTTRFDGVLWLVDSHGKLWNRFAYNQWLEGPVAFARQPGGATPMLALLESAGKVQLVWPDNGHQRELLIGGSPCLGTGPAFADLDYSGSLELLCAGREGVLTVLDEGLKPLWRYNAGARVDASPVAAPVFERTAGVYIQTAEGALHCLSGDGQPLWSFEVPGPPTAFPFVADPLVTQLGAGSPSVLVSDMDGTLYAVDAVTGQEQWRCDIGGGALGSPAVFDVLPSPGNEIVVVSRKGQLVVLSSEGEALATGALPEGTYVPRPLLADVDGDGPFEVIVADHKYAVVVASLDGQIKERFELMGSARAGLTLADLEGDGLLELLAATDCARVYCFETQARAGWLHHRGGNARAGYHETIQARSPMPETIRARRRPRLRDVAVPDSVEGNPFSTVSVCVKPRRDEREAVAVVRRYGRAVGAATSSVENGRVNVPIVSEERDNLTLDLAMRDEAGQTVAAVQGVSIGPGRTKTVTLCPPDELQYALRERGDAFAIPSAWRLPVVCGRDSWHVARYELKHWDESGLPEESFISDATPRIWSPAGQASAVFGPGHLAWAEIQQDSKPFFIMNDYFRPKAAYPDEEYKAIENTAGDRFLGFPVHEWAYDAWKRQLESGVAKPSNHEEATAVLRAHFDELLELCRDKMYQGQGYCLFHHQAFAWGAELGYAEVGENIPCAPLQFAFLRGASRQYGGKPWGAYLSNWFRGTVLNSQFRPDIGRTKWDPWYYADGLDCGHSPSLEFRLEMAAHLAGATFVHHESDGHHGSVFVTETAPGQWSLSTFGQNMRQWYEYSRHYPGRGVPYTPVAFLVDFNHGWRPRENIFGIWLPSRAERSMEAMFEEVFPYGGRLDFERGYLANGAYGDIFDVLTNDASADVLSGYGVVWPLGNVTLENGAADTLMAYVRQGGILVLDSALAAAFQDEFLGVRLGDDPHCAVQIQTSLGSMPPLTVPYRCCDMRLRKGAQALAWDERGRPVLAWRRAGDGLVVVSATHHWTDETDQLLPLANAILESIATAFLPVRASTDVEMLLNRTQDGWIVGLINNHGVTKVPTQPAVVDVSERRDCVLRFRGDGPLRYVSRMGEFRWNSAAGGLHTRLRPGGVAVVELQCRAESGPRMHNN